MNRWILGLALCAFNLVDPGLAAAEEAKAGNDAAVKEAPRIREKPKSLS